jgi:excisionase family DNA binding protein
MSETSEQKLTLSVDEAAQLLGVSSGLVYELVRTKRLSAVRLGRRILIPRRVVEDLVHRPDSAA